MKKLICLCLALLLVMLTLAGCGKNKTGESTSVPGGEPSEESVPMEEPVSMSTEIPDTQPVPVETTVESEPETTEPAPPEEVLSIDEAGLKAALDDCLSGLISEWQVVVMDPIVGTKVESCVNVRNANEYMKGDRMLPVYIMAAAFQSVADGVLTEEDILEDVRAMIVRGDNAAADRLTDLVGGKEPVKQFVSDIGLDRIGYNRTMSGSGSKPNYVKGRQLALILDMMCRGELVSKEASDKMLEILCEPRDSEEIDLGISDETIRYGFVSYAEDKVCVATMGVVILPHRSYVVSVICNGPNALNSAKSKVTQMLSIILAYFQD